MIIKHDLIFASSLHVCEYIECGIVLHKCFDTLSTEVLHLEDIPNFTYELGLQGIYCKLLQGYNSTYVNFYGVGNSRANIREERGRDRDPRTFTQAKQVRHEVQSCLARFGGKEELFFIGSNVPNYLSSAYKLMMIIGLEIRNMLVMLLGQGLSY